MDRKEAKRVIRSIAKKERKDEKLIREEMKKAITIGYMNTDRQKNWIEMFGDEHIPDPEEFIIQLSNRVKRNLV